MNIPTSLGQLIRLYRDEKGMSRTKLAQFCDISPNSMVKYESAGEVGGKYPSAKNLVKICEVLEIDPRIAFDHIKLEDIQIARMKYREANPSATEIDVLLNIDEGINFSQHFMSDEEALGLKNTVDKMADINSKIFELSEGLEKRLAKLENENSKEEKDLD